MHPDAWNGAVSLYVTAMRAAGRANGTVRLHTHYLSLLRRHHRHPWRITTAQLQLHLANPAWSAETRKSARTVWRGFYRWGHGMGHTEENPALALEAIRPPRKRPRPAPHDVVQVGLSAPIERIVLMVMLARHCGLRVSEISQVHRDDLEDDVLLVHGKGSKERQVPVLDEWLLSRLRGSEGWLFPNGRGGHLSPGHVCKLLSRALPGRWTAHPLRHRFATDALAGTNDLLAVMELLGHSRPETTMIYTEVVNDRLRRAARAALDTAA